MIKEQSISYEDWGVAEERLRNWRMRAQRNQIFHYSAAQRSKRAHYIIGVPTIGLAALLSTMGFLGVGFNGSHEKWITIVIGTLGALVTILTSLQTFLNFSNTSDSHTRAGVRFGNIARQIESVLAIPREDRGAILQVIQRISEMMSAAAGEAPTLSAKLIRQVTNSVLEDAKDRSLENPWDIDRPDSLDAA